MADGRNSTTYLLRIMKIIKILYEQIFFRRCGRWSKWLVRYVIFRRFDAAATDIGFWTSVVFYDFRFFPKDSITDCAYTEPLVCGTSFRRATLFAVSVDRTNGGSFLKRFKNKLQSIAVPFRTIEHLAGNVRGTNICCGNFSWHRHGKRLGREPTNDTFRAGHLFNGPCCGWRASFSCTYHNMLF